MFNQYPYLNLNDLNLDYILKAIREMRYEVSNFVAINAIKYADPIQWNITSQYEKNTVVIDPLTGVAYISVAPVPSGVALTRTEFWTVVFDLGSFVTRAAQNFTSRWESDTTLTATFPTNTGEWLVWGDVLYKALTNIVAGDQYVVGSNIEHFTIEDLYNSYLNTIATILSMIGDLVDLNTADKTSIVNAINSVVTDYNDIIGDLNDLTTTDKTNIVSAINELSEIVGENGENVNPYLPIRQGRVRYNSTTVNYVIIDKAYKPRFVTAEDSIVDGLNNFITGDVALKSLNEKASVIINAAAMHSSNTQMGTTIVDGVVKYSSNLDYSEWGAYDLENLYMTNDGTLHVVDAFTSESDMLALAPVWSFNAFSAIYKNGSVNTVIDANQVSPKTVIGQDGDGNYIVLTSGGRQYREHGLTYADITYVVKSVIGFDAVLLYNCDGGGSSALLTHQMRQNALVENEPRKVPSMIVFNIDTNYSDVESDYSAYLTDIYNSRPEKDYEINSYSSTGMINIRNLSYNNAGVAFYRTSVNSDDECSFDIAMQFKYYDNNHKVVLTSLDGNGNRNERIALDPDGGHAEILGREVLRGRHVYKHTATVTTNNNGVFDGGDFIGANLPLTATILSAYTTTNSKLIMPFNYNDKWQFAVKNVSDLSTSANSTIDVTIIWIDDPTTFSYT